MMKMLKGTILKGGQFLEFHIYLYAPPEVIKDIEDVLKRKLQEKGWIPNANRS